MKRIPIFLALIAVLAITAIMVFKGSDGDPVRVRPSTATATSTPGTVNSGVISTTPGDTLAEPRKSAVDPVGRETAIVATATVPTVDVFREPSGPAPFAKLSNPIPSGGPLVFLVEERIEGWLRVLLPMRPNGSQGWIRTSDATLAQHRYRIDVHLAEFRLDVFNTGKLIYSAPIAIARENAPTPGGRYYTTELLRPPTPDTAYGALAYGLSGFSDVFTSFNGGPGQLGIHGTNDPTTIGSKVSSGCIRMRNEDILEIAKALPLGVPVNIFSE